MMYATDVLPDISVGPISRNRIWHGQREDVNVRPEV